MPLGSGAAASRAVASPGETGTVILTRGAEETGTSGTAALDCCAGESTPAVEPDPELVAPGLGVGVRGGAGVRAGTDATTGGAGADAPEMAGGVPVASAAGAWASGGGGPDEAHGRYHSNSVRNPALTSNAARITGTQTRRAPEGLCTVARSGTVRALRCRSTFRRASRMYDMLAYLSPVDSRGRPASGTAALRWARVSSPATPSSARSRLRWKALTPRMTSAS